MENKIESAQFRVIDPEESQPFTTFGIVFSKASHFNTSNMATGFDLTAFDLTADDYLKIIDASLKALKYQANKPATV